MSEHNGEVPVTLSQRYSMLRVLRDCQQSSLKRGEWQTVCNLEGLAEVVGLDTLSTADLFRSLEDEGYLRGHLIYQESDLEG